MYLFTIIKSITILIIILIKCIALKNKKKSRLVNKLLYYFFVKQSAVFSNTASVSMSDSYICRVYQIIRNMIKMILMLKNTIYKKLKIYYL